MSFGYCHYWGQHFSSFLLFFLYPKLRAVFHSHNALVLPAFSRHFWLLLFGCWLCIHSVIWHRPDHTYLASGSFKRWIILYGWRCGRMLLFSSLWIEIEDSYQDLFVACIIWREFMHNSFLPNSKTADQLGLSWTQDIGSGGGAFCYIYKSMWLCRADKAGWKIYKSLKGVSVF